MIDSSCLGYDGMYMSLLCYDVMDGSWLWGMDGWVGQLWCIDWSWLVMMWLVWVYVMMYWSWLVMMGVMGVGYDWLMCELVSYEVMDVSWLVMIDWLEFVTLLCDWWELVMLWLDVFEFVSYDGLIGVC